jgi:hypothetical protein
MRRGVATFTLDYGKAPRWLFERMVRLGREMSRVLVEEFGSDEFIRRMSDPVWFQSLGTVLAFDWNASGLTTVLMGALKEAIRGMETELGVYIAGGKGKTSRKTPEQILQWADHIGLEKQLGENLVYNSKMAAKVDSALVQDGYQIYHHNFLFTKNGAWTVIQQGMNTDSGTARRYHWSSDSAKDLIVEPHAAIASQKLPQRIDLNMTAADAESNRKLAVDLLQSSFSVVLKDIQILRKHFGNLSQTLAFTVGEDEYVAAKMARKEFTKHPVMHEDFSKSKYLEKVLQKLVDVQPENYEKLLFTEGVGPKTIRALALVAELIYDAPASRIDPARYSFAHGGKDATPYPVDQNTYDQTIEIMKQAVVKTKLPESDKNQALKRLL